MTRTSIFLKVAETAPLDTMTWTEPRPTRTSLSKSPCRTKIADGGSLPQPRKTQSETPRKGTQQWTCGIAKHVRSLPPKMESKGRSCNVKVTHVRLAGSVAKQWRHSVAMDKNDCCHYSSPVVLGTRARAECTAGASVGRRPTECQWMPQRSGRRSCLLLARQSSNTGQPMKSCIQLRRRAGRKRHFPD